MMAASESGSGGSLARAVRFATRGLRMRDERRDEIERIATARGLDFSHEDPLELSSLPFGLFRRGERRGCENVAHGDIDGTSCRTFDYWYYVERDDGHGNRERVYSRFTCATSQSKGHASWPHLTIGRENLATRAADAVGLRDLQFESDEFNRAFLVRCKDRRFANAFVDARMMQWLLSTPQWTSFEVVGGAMLCVSPWNNQPESLSDLVNRTAIVDKFRTIIRSAGLPPADVFFAPQNILMDFRRNVPRVVFELYPK